jgi:hypothetical protein
MSSSDLKLPSSINKPGTVGESGASAMRADAARGVAFETIFAFKAINPRVHSDPRKRSIPCTDKLL